MFVYKNISVYFRGHANCNPFNDIKEQIMDYIADRDNWYYILRYNPDTRRMANAKGEIRIGASHQVSFFNIDHQIGSIMFSMLSTII